jgi:hypothetical protein
MKDCKWVIRSNQIKDCPVTVQDVDVAHQIWGKNIDALKGKTTRSKSDLVIARVHELGSDQPEQLTFTDRHGRLIGDVEIPGMDSDAIGDIEIPGVDSDKADDVQFSGEDPVIDDAIEIPGADVEGPKNPTMLSRSQERMWKDRKIPPHELLRLMISTPPKSTQIQSRQRLSK